MRFARRLERIDIEPHLADLALFFTSQPDILAAYIYGSYGTVYQTVLSDVDLAVLFHKDCCPDSRRILALEAAISSICREDDINVLVLNDAPIMLQFKALITGRAIYEKDPVAVQEFREFACRSCWDFGPFHRASCRDYDEFLGEVYVRDRTKRGVDRDKVRGKVASISKNLTLLRGLAETSREAFNEASVEFHATLRLLQVSIEAMIDIGSHIASREGLGSPRSYGEVFDLLVSGKVIPTEFLPWAKEMVRFRNRMVHLYMDIDVGYVYSLLHDGLGDFETFVGLIVSKYLPPGSKEVPQ